MSRLRRRRSCWWCWGRAHLLGIDLGVRQPCQWVPAILNITSLLHLLLCCEEETHVAGKYLDSSVWPQQKVQIICVFPTINWLSFYLRSNVNVFLEVLVIHHGIAFTHEYSELLGGIALHLTGLCIPEVGHKYIHEDWRCHIIREQQVWVTVLLILSPQLVSKFTKARDVLAEFTDCFFYDSFDVTEIDIGLRVALYGCDALLVQANHGFDEHLIILLPPIRYNIIQVVFDYSSILRNIDVWLRWLILTLGLVVFRHLMTAEVRESLLVHVDHAHLIVVWATAQVEGKAFSFRRRVQEIWGDSRHSSPTLQRRLWPRPLRFGGLLRILVRRFSGNEQILLLIHGTTICNWFLVLHDNFLYISIVIPSFFSSNIIPATALGIGLTGALAGAVQLFLELPY